MNPLSLAYVCVAGMIAALIVLGKWNQKQGWRKRRIHWLEEQTTAAMKTFAARNASAARSDAPLAHVTVNDAPLAHLAINGAPLAHLAVNDAPLAHLGDLSRLNQALVAHNDSQEPAEVTEENLSKSL